MKQGIMQTEPDVQRNGADEPTVLLYVDGNDAGKLKGWNADVKTAMQLLERFMLNEYRALFPNYVVVRPPLDPYEAMHTQEADYLLQIKFDAVTNQYNNNWFLTVEQTLSDKNGNVLASGSAGKRTSPLAGNILAAMEVLSVEKEELLKQLPWVQGNAGK